MTVTTDIHLDVDGNGDGDWADSLEDWTDYVLNVQTVTGRDYASQLTGRATPGRLFATLRNDDDRFSTFNYSSALATQPTFVAAGSASFADATAPTPTLPAGLALGDYMVTFFYSREATDGTVAISSGWKEIYNSRDSSGLLAAWGRVYQTGDAAPTFTLGGHAANDTVGAHIAAWRNVNTARPIGIKGAIASNGSAQDIGAITGITLPAKGLLIVLGGKADDWTSVATLSQSGMTFAEIGEPDSTAGSDAGLVWDYATVDAGTALAVTSKTFAVTGGASAVGKGVMFSLNAAHVKQGSLVRLRDNTDVLWVGRLARLLPTVNHDGSHVAVLEALGPLAEAAGLEIEPLFSATGEATGTLMIAALTAAGMTTTGIETGDITTGLFGTAGVAKVPLLDELRSLEECEFGFLHEDQAAYRLLFHDRSHREAITSPDAVFSDDPLETLHYETIIQEDAANYVYNRCIAGVSPYTLGTAQVLATIPGPYTLNPGESVNLIATYTAAPLVTWVSRSWSIRHGGTVPVYQSTVEVNTDSGTTKNVTLHATINAGDLLLIWFIADDTVASGPSGFTELLTATIGAGSTLKVYGKVAVGDEDSTVVTITTDNSAASGLQAQRFTNWYGELSSIEFSTVATGTSTAPNATAVTPSWGSTVIPAIFVTFYAHEGLGAGDGTNPSGYTGWDQSGGSVSGPGLTTSRRAESTGVASEDAGAFTLTASRTWKAWTLAIRGAQETDAGSDNTPNTRDGAFTLSYDSSLDGGVGTQYHETIQITGTPLVEGDNSLAQSDYLPSQNSVKGVGIRTYRTASDLFANIDDAQEYADEVVERFGEAIPVMSLSYTANKNASLYAQFIARNVGDRITLEANNEAGLGVSEDFFIESIARSIGPGLIECTYALSPASVSD